MINKDITTLNSFDLLEAVFELVRLKYEGEWWDFKRQWPDEHSLLHDIICMANNTSFRTAFLIIGVDEEEDFSFRSTENDARLKNTQLLVDFLKDKPFLGGERPEVEVRRLNIDEHTCIDVIIIYSTRHVPYVLSRDWKGLKAGNIYTRVNDSNTSVSATADLDKSEKLWRHRFYLDTCAVDKMSLYITNHDNWHNGYSDKDDNSWFYVRHPEYILGILDDERNGSEYYHVNQCDNTPLWGLLYLRYHQTVINRFDIIYLDGGRYFNLAPSNTCIKGLFYPTHWEQSYSYCYFVKDTDEYRLFELFNHMQQDSYSALVAQNRFVKSIVIYNSINEKMMIDNRISSDIEGFKELVDSNIPDIYFDKTFNDEQKEFFSKSFGVVNTINSWLNEYRLKRL